MSKLLRVGTRSSRLAMVQARTVAEALVKKMDFAIQYELVPIKTTGDILYHQSLAAIGGKGLFLKEIEEALIEKKIDFAVHSMKDMPVIGHDELALPCVMLRDTAADCLIVSPKLQNVAERLQHMADAQSTQKFSTLNQIEKDLSVLPKNALVGTCSTRRKSILLHYRNDLRVVEMRGNVDSRLSKVADGLYDAAVLATAGLQRLGLLHHTQKILDMKYFTPAAAQGAIVAQCRRDNWDLCDALAKLNDIETEICVTAERAFLQHITGDCTTPVGAYAEILGYIKNNQTGNTIQSCIENQITKTTNSCSNHTSKKLKLNAMFASPNGKKMHRVYNSKIVINREEAYSLGQVAAESVLSLIR